MKIIYITIVIFVLYINYCFGQVVGNLCLKCLKENERCNALGVCGKDLVCSSKSKLFVEKPECMVAIKEGGQCLNNEQCLLGLKCHFTSPTAASGTCSNILFAQVNEKCKSGSDCAGKELQCKNSRCIRKNDMQCNIDNPCPFGEYCSLPSRECKKLSKENDSCSFSVECPYGTFCDVNSNKCKKLFSLEKDDKCQAYSNDQCNVTSGVYCGTTGICEKLDLENPGECFGMTNLCAPFHKCSCTDFKCHPTKLFGKEFQDSITNFYECANNHKCQFTINRFSPSSCITQNCAAEFCKFNFALSPDNPLNCDRTPIKTYCQKYANIKDFKSLNSINSNTQIQKSKSNLVLCTTLIPIAILIFSVVVEIRLRSREKDF